jgi:hypothetical protein
MVLLVARGVIGSAWFMRRHERSRVREMQLAAAGN